MADALLTPEAVAEVLGVTREHVLALVRGKAIGAVRVSPRKVRIPSEALEAWIRRAYNPAQHEEAQGESKRGGLSLPGITDRGPRRKAAKAAAAVVCERHRGLDPRGASGAPVPLLRVEG